MQKIVRALDVGYGNVKFVLDQRDLESDPVVDKFASRAVISNEADMSAGTMARRRTVHVDANGTRFEVGYDVALAQGTYDESNSLAPDFCITTPYLARVLGALYYMYDGLDERREIDVLVCGLPVTTFHTYRAELMSILTREFRLPSGRIIKINKTIVIPQPMGAYFHYLFDTKGNGASQKQFLEQNNLVIDLGYFTFDWLVSEGMKPNTNSCGSVFRGMSAVIEAMAKDIAKKEKCQYKQIKTNGTDENFPIVGPLRVYLNNRYCD